MKYRSKNDHHAYISNRVKHLTIFLLRLLCSYFYSVFFTITPFLITTRIVGTLGVARGIDLNIEGVAPITERSCKEDRNYNRAFRSKV